MLQRLPLMAKVLVVTVLAAFAVYASHAIFNSANDAIFVFDVESGNVLDANPKAEQLLGRARATIVGLHYAEMHPPEEEQDCRAASKGSKSPSPRASSPSRTSGTPFTPRTAHTEPPCRRRGL